MERQYEVITYRDANFTCKAGTTGYCMPHIHREIEIGVTLRGVSRFQRPGREELPIPEGQLWLLNSVQPHEVYSEAPTLPYTFLVIQLPSSFFREYCPELMRTEFLLQGLTDETVGRETRIALGKLLLEVCEIYFSRRPHYTLYCAAGINRLFALLLDKIPHRLMDEQELQAAGKRGARIQRITDYIEENCGQKLLLNEIAEREGLTRNYLSHFFTDNYGMSFQEYLTRIRCQKARSMLLKGDLSLTDISLACGFSAIRYLTQGFVRQYGVTPQDFRRQEREKLHENDPEPSGLRQPNTEDYPGVIYNAEESIRQIDAFLGRNPEF